MVEAFTSLYTHTLDTWANTFWLGHRVVKNPFDLWVYQEILWETRPTVIVEMGSSIGGSALFFASMFDLIGEGRIVSVDKDSYVGEQPRHRRITFLVGDSVAPETVSHVMAGLEGERVMVALDSDHSYDHVSAELACYGHLVTPGCYLVVEDTWAAPGAAQACSEYVSARDGDFEIDQTREKHLMTFNPGGWLRRVR